MKVRLLDLLLILIAAVVLYGRVSLVYFCGYDDFREINRAAFEDTREPARIFTTTHYGSSKYRPLQRGFNDLLWRIGNGSVIPFRFRNLFFHVAAAFLVYGIALLLAGDRATAFTAGLFFSLYPVANQSVVAASWTNTCAYAVLLGAFFLFLVGLQRNRRMPVVWSLFLTLIGVFLYEPVIVVFGMMGACLLLWRIRGRAIERTWAVTWAGGCAAILVVFAVVRHFVVHAANQRASLADIVHGVVLYTAALLSPIDIILAHALFGAPLPPEIHPGRQLLLWAGLGCIAIVLTVFAVVRTQRFRVALRRLDIALIAFLAASIGMSLLPVLVFTPHASETYLYLPAALYSILLSVFLRDMVSNRTVRLVVVSLLLCSFAAGIWLRNRRVATCGEIAGNIMAQLPLSHWASGDWTILLARAPGEPVEPRYGIYAYTGLSTIDPSEPSMTSAEWAIQVGSHNDRVHADVVDADFLKGHCDIPETCFVVSRNGNVKEYESIVR